MRRNFKTALAVLASAFFVGATSAQAYDPGQGFQWMGSKNEASAIKMGGQIWTRYEATGQHDFNPDTRMNQSIASSVRLDATANINDSTSGYIQLQSVRTWGADSSGSGTAGGLAFAPTGTTNTGSGNAAITPHDQDTSVGVHQAYVKVKSFFTLPVELQIGRQEVVLDGHRLFGNVFWTLGGRSHDAIRLTHAAGDHAIAYVFSKGAEGGMARSTAGVNSGDVDDQYDVNVHVLYANLKNMLHNSSALSLYFTAVDANGFTLDPASSNTLATVATGTGVFQNGITAKNNIYLLGFRQDAKNVEALFGIDYRAEFYYEFGDAESDAARAGSAVYGAAATSTSNYYANQGIANGAGSGIDRRAYMFGLRAGKTFKDVTWTPNATLWYDHLSGTNDEDVRNKRFGSFNTLFHTGHKYYGYMDNFVASTHMGTNYLGLRDLAGKFSVNPLENTKVSFDMHAFWTDTNLADNQGIRTSIMGASPSAVNLGSHLGEELDITLQHKYNPHVYFTAGFSRFWADDTFHAISSQVSARAASAAAGASTTNAGNANWAYVMMDVMF